MWKNSLAAFALRQRRPSGETRLRKKLEAETGLHLNGARAQGALRLAEEFVIDVALNSVELASALQVELVEQVVEVGAELNLRAFSNYLHARQPKRLAESGIHIKVARARERIACNSRSCRNRTQTDLARRTSWSWSRHKETIEKNSPRSIRGREKR